MANVKFYDAMGTGVDMRAPDLAGMAAGTPVVADAGPYYDWYNWYDADVYFGYDDGSTYAVAAVTELDDPIYLVQSMAFYTDTHYLATFDGLDVEVNVDGDFYDGIVWADTALRGDDQIVGNKYADRLLGRAGDDDLWGRGGNDTLVGGTGADWMVGGAGDDSYVVDSRWDRVFETTRMGGSTDAGGHDTVNSLVTFSLAATAGVSFVEDLALTGASAIDGTGNALDNLLTGNVAANTLRGLGGDDTLAGAAGADQLYGNDGADLLRGGTGNDTLTGGAGADHFRFDTAPSTRGNMDRITDFAPASDTIELDHGVFRAFGSATGALDADNFRANSTGRAVDANDFLIYETDTGKLFYDADGSGAGAAVQIALLGANLPLTAADFVLV